MAALDENFDPITWPAPDPILLYGLYSYSCTCKLCGESGWSDKGMLNPERSYRRHYWLKHAIPQDAS